MTTNIIQNKSILVVDDDEGMLRALDKVLTAEGAIVTTAKWAGDAIDTLTQRKTHIDLVITDMMMPLVAGPTLIFAIHNIFPNLPIIVLSACATPDIKRACGEQGARTFLEKPLNAAELLAAIEEVFAQTAVV